MDVAELSAYLKAEVGPFLRNMDLADREVDQVRRSMAGLERAAHDVGAALDGVRITQSQAYESRAALETIERSVSSVNAVALLTADHLHDVKVKQEQAVETKVSTDSIKDQLDGLILKAEETRLALRRVNGGTGGGYNPPGINGLGLRGTAIAAGVGLALPALPELAAGTLGLGAGAAGGMGALFGGAAVLKLALADLSKQAFTDQAAFDKLTKSQQGLVTELRSLDAGLKTHLEAVAQSTVIPGLEQGIKSAASGSTVAAITNDVQAFSSAVSQAAQEWGKFIGGPFGSELGQLLQRDSGYFVSLNEEVMRGGDIVVRFLNAASPVTDWLDHAAAGASRAADAWAQSARGQQEMTNVAKLAEQGLRDVGGLLDALLHDLEALSGATGSVNTITLLSAALSEVAQIIDQNHNELRSFFAGVDASAHDVLAVVHALETPLHDLVVLIGDVAGELGGWRTVIDAFAAVWAAKSIASISWVGRLLAAVGLVGPTTVGATAEADAALAGLTAAAEAASAALTGLGPAAVAGGAEVDAALASTGAVAATTAGEITGIRSALIGLGSAEVLGALAVLAGPLAILLGLQAKSPVKNFQGTATGAEVYQGADGQWMQKFGRAGVRQITPEQAAALGATGAGAGSSQRGDMRGAGANHGETYGTAYYKRIAGQYAATAGVPSSLFLAQINQESGFNPNAVSKAGALGIAQFMPGTAKGLGVDPQDPLSSLSGAAKLMASYYKKYGRWDLALAAYNGGPGAVDYYLKHGYFPTEETTNYVNSILGASGIPGGAEPGSAFGTPSPLTPNKPKKPAIPSGLNLLPNSLAAALQNAQSAATAAGIGSSSGSGFSDPKQVVSATSQVIAEAQKALAILDGMKASGKELVNIATERKSLEQQITSATNAQHVAQKQIAQDALASKERGILGIGANGSSATSSVLSLRAQATALGKQISKATGEGIDESDVKASLAKIQQVLKYDFVPPDVRQAITSQFATIKQTITQQLSDALAAAKSALADATTAFESGFGQVQGAVDAQFGANVNAHVQSMQESVTSAVNAMQVMVSGPFGQFLFGGGITQTPAQQALAALQSAHTQQQLQQALTDAQNAVAAAQGGDGHIFDRATGLTTTIPGDPSALLAAQQQLADAQYAIQQDALSTEADAEAQAASDQLKAAQDSYTTQQQAAIDAYQAQQQIVQTAMDQQVAAIVTGMESGKIDTQTGIDEIKAIWSQAGIDLGTLSFALGGQIYTGLAAGLKPISALLLTMIADLNTVLTLSGQSQVNIVSAPSASSAGLGIVPGAGARGGTFTAFAGGGLVTSKHWLVDASTGMVTGVMGEDGTEAIVPAHVSTSTGPRPSASRVGYAAGGGGGDVTVNITFSGPVLGTPAELAKEITPMVRTALQKGNHRNSRSVVTF